MVSLRLALFIFVVSFATGSQAQNPIDSRLAKLELILDERKQQPVQNEMVLATLRGTYGVQITLEKVVMPRMREVDWVQLDHDKWSAASINGRSVRVMERRLAFFPLRSGDVPIKPAVQHLTILDPGTGQRSEVTISAEQVALKVQDSLAADRSWWLPARAVEITDEWSKDPAQLADGDSVVRTVTLSALGATEQMLPPQPAMREPWLITFTDAEQRGMALTPAGPLTKVVWRWTLRPVTGEPGVIPQVDIPWFDTEQRQPKVAIIEAQPFGYSGFGANTGAGWQIGFSGWNTAVFAFLFGLIVPLILVSPRGRVRTAAEFAARFRRLLPHKDLLSLRRAARAGDVFAMRKAAYALATAAPPTARLNLEPMLQSFDRSLFGLMSTPIEPVSFARSFERALRKR